jgi:hypothetical protein
MREVTLAVLVFVVALATFTPGRSTADGPAQAEARTRNELVGTWKMVKAKYGGREAKILDDHTEFKHITPRFMLVALTKMARLSRPSAGPTS